MLQRDYWRRSSGGIFIPGSDVLFIGDTLTGGTTVPDDSGNGYDGTATDVTQSLVDGMESLQFNGTTSYVEFADNSLWSSVEELTISLWVRTTTEGNWVTKINPTYSAGQGFIFLRRLVGNSDFRIGNTGGSFVGISFVTDVLDGAWHWISGSYGAGGMTLYVDGELDSSTSTYIGAASTIDGEWNIGRDPRDIDYLSGSIAGVGLKPYALNEIQHRELYRRALKGIYN